MDINTIESFDLADAVEFNDELNPALWDGDKLKPEVRDHLLKIADDFRDFLGVPDLSVTDITISGSNASYSYTQKSDIDLHLVADIPKLDQGELYRELFNAKKYQYNDEHDIKIKGHQVELYVQNPAEEHFSQGIYSVLNDDWISIPKKRRATVDDMSVKAKYDTLAPRIESAIKSESYEAIDTLIDKIRTMRRAGLEQGGEFSPENLVFKMLRNQGYIDRLYDARRDAKSEKMSLEHASSRKDKQPREYGWVGDAAAETDQKPLDVPTLTPQEIAGRHKVPLEMIQAELKRGIEVELEHTTDRKAAREIALDHLLELPDYYTRLSKMEKEGEAQLNEILKKVNGKWALVSRKDPSKVLQYYDGSGKPSDEWVKKVERRVHSFSESAGSAKDIAASIRQQVQTTHPGVEFDVFAGNNDVLIVSKISVPRDIQKLGVATHLLKDLISKADQHNLRVALTPTNEFGASKLRLIEFYKRFGFVMNKGRNKDFTISELMYREPKRMVNELSHVKEMGVGRITKQNRTKDVGPNEIKKQAAKFGNKVSKDGVPALLMRGEPVAESIELLNEVNMSPSVLRQWAESPEAEGILVGFEAELIMPNGLRDPEGEWEEDYSEDESAGSIDDIRLFFARAGVNIRADLIHLEREYDNWADEQVDEIVRDNEDSWYSDFFAEREEYWDRRKDDILWAHIKAAGVDEDRIDDIINEEGEEYQSYHDEAKEEFDDETRELFDDELDEKRDEARNDLDWYEFAADHNVDTMSGFADEYGVVWPYMTQTGGSGDFDVGSAEALGDSLDGALGVSVEVFDDSHAYPKNHTSWYIEPDGSITPAKDGDMGVEIISPPMPLSEITRVLPRFINWVDREGLYTNSTTGFHIGVSLPAGDRPIQSTRDIDQTKLLLLLGGNYVLDEFGRRTNHFTRSQLDFIKRRIAENPETAVEAIIALQSGLEGEAGKEVEELKSSDKYTDVNVKPTYIEFRSAGGSDYTSDINRLLTTVYRFARAMTIAKDPNAYKKEYTTKLYKLLSNAVEPKDLDIVSMFVSYAANRDLNALKQNLRALNVKRGNIRNNRAVKIYSDAIIDGLLETNSGPEWARWVRGFRVPVDSSLYTAKTYFENVITDLVQAKRIHATEAEAIRRQAEAAVKGLE